MENLSDIDTYQMNLNYWYMSVDGVIDSPQFYNDEEGNTFVIFVSSKELSKTVEF